MFAIILKNLFRMEKGATAKMATKTKVGTYIFLGIVFVFLEVLLSMAMYRLGVFSKGKVAMPLLLLMVALMVLELIFSLSMMISIVCGKNYNSVYLTLPVKMSTVCLADLLYVYIHSLAIFVALAFIPYVCLGIAGGMGVVYYVSFIFAGIIGPALPILLAMLVALIVGFVSSFFKRNSLVMGILVALFACAFVGLYLWVCLAEGSVDASVAEADALNYMLQSMMNTMRSIAPYILPIYALTSFASGESFFSMSGGGAIALELLSFIGISLALFALTALVMIPFFNSIAHRSLEHKKNTKVTQKKDYGTRSIPKALMIQDLKRTFRSPQIMINYVLLPFICILLSVMFSIMIKPEPGEMVEGIESVLSVTIYMLIILCSGIFSMSAASTAFSREGKSYKMLKSLPVSAWQVMVSKAIPIFLIACGTSIVSFVIAACLSYLDIVQLILFFVATTLCNLFVVFNAIEGDCKKPNYDWNDITQLVKGTSRKSMNMIKLLVGTLAVMILFYGTICMLPMVFPENGVVIKAVAWPIILVGLLVLTIWQIKHAKKHVDEYWAATE